jgi:hypothetical protein
MYFSFVSVHLPKQRLFSEIAILKLKNITEELMKNDIDLCSYLFCEENIEKKYLCNLIELPLRIQVFIKQVNMGLWVRNGYSVESEANIYTTPFQEGQYVNLFEEDLTLIQICGVLFNDINLFLVYLMESYKITSFFEESLFPELVCSL